MAKSNAALSTPVCAPDTMRRTLVISVCPRFATYEIVLRIVLAGQITGRKSAAPSLADGLPKEPFLLIGAPRSTRSVLTKRCKWHKLFTVTGIRITGGTHKGRRIAAAQDHRTRYTSAKVREAVFDLVGDIEGLAVLDLFAGAGSFTAEALSRAAASVTAVEKDRHTASLLRANLKSSGLR